MADMLSSRPEPAAGRHLWRMELVASLLLGLAAVGSGWAAYQAARWSSDQTFTLDRAWEVRRKATIVQNRAYLMRVVQVGLFTDYMQAMRQNDTGFADFLLARFPPPLKTAMSAWLATKPFKNPEAPSTPFAMKQYQIPEDAEAKRLAEEGNEITSEAQRESNTSDDYILLTVPFATVSLFAGLSSVFESPGVRTAIVAVAFTVLATAAVVVTSMPVS